MSLATLLDDMKPRISFSSPLAAHKLPYASLLANWALIKTSKGPILRSWTFQFPRANSSLKQSELGVVKPTPRGSKDRIWNFLSPSATFWMISPARSTKPTPEPLGPPGLMMMLPAKEGSLSSTTAGRAVMASTTRFSLPSGSSQSSGTDSLAHLWSP